jgi:hypothetical protein
MKIPDLRVALAAEHHGQPQVQMTIEHGLRAVEQGLAELAKCGHVFHLEDGPPQALPEWPKLMFHVKSAPNGRVVRDAQELTELGPGWHRTLEAAQHADGVETQFAGRGGVARKGALVTVELPDPAGSREIARRQLDDLVAKWKLEHPKIGVTT